MQVLVNAFLRFLSFLLPPSWLQLAFRWWVGGDECGGSPWPNRGSAFARTKPLIAHEEVTARGDSRPPGRVSVAAAPPALSAATGATTTTTTSLPPPPPPDSPRFPWPRFQETVELVLAAPSVIPERRCQDAPGDPHPGGAIEDTGAPCRARSSDTVMSAATELPNPVEVVGTVTITSSSSSSSSSAAASGFPDHRLREMGTPVTITVAIQAAEDEEPDEEETINSEDEIIRHEKSRWVCVRGPFFFSFPNVGFFK